MRRQIHSLPNGGQRLVYDFTQEETKAARYLDFVEDESLGHLARAISHHMTDPDGGTGISLAGAMMVFIRACAEKFVDSLTFDVESVEVAGGNVGRWRLIIERVPDDEDKPGAEPKPDGAA